MDRYPLELTEGELIVLRKLIAATRAGAPVRTGLEQCNQMRAFNSLERKVAGTKKHDEGAS